MEFINRLYIAFSKLVPLTYRSHLKELIVYSGERINYETYTGAATLLSLLGAAIVIMIPYSLFLEKDKIFFIISAPLVFLLLEATAYMMIYFKVEDRSRRVDDVLPDFLQLVSSNIKAGMSPFEALKASSRKEFGPLKEEIEHATSKSLGTESFSDILRAISKKIKSEVLERAIELFTTALSSGGHLAKLLSELASDIEETRSLKKELVTSTKQYIAFIFFTIIIGTPMLLSISIQFIDIITALQAKIGDSTAGFGMNFLAGDIAITSDFMMKMSVFILVVISFLASILLGVILEGKPKYGFRYAPVIIAGTLIVFVIIRYFISNFFGSTF
jgi:pilus assembly protein TadC